MEPKGSLQELPTGLYPEPDESSLHNSILLVLVLRWGRRPPDIEGSCEYIEQAVCDSQQWVVLQFYGLGVGPETPR
jgi:hypothetical protein